MSAQASFQPIKPLDPAQFAKTDAVIKLWLTEPVVEVIDLISIENDNSRQYVLRSILFEHIYGSAALVQFIQWRSEQKFAQNKEPRRQISSHVSCRLRSCPGRLGPVLAVGCVRMRGVVSCLIKKNPTPIWSD